MSEVSQVQCANIKSRKFSRERCPYKTSSGEFCSRHRKNPHRFQDNKTKAKPIPTRSQHLVAKKIQTWWKRIHGFKMVQQRSPAFFVRNLCHNDSELASLDSLDKIPRAYFFAIRENTRLWGFDIRTLLCQYELDGHLKNPYTQEICSGAALELFRKSVDHLRKFKIPVQYEEAKGLSMVQSWNLRVLDLCLRLDMLGYRIATQWFSELNIMEHRRLYVSLYNLWNEELGLTEEQKERIVPNFSAGNYKLFKWSAEHVFMKSEIDSIRRTTLNIMERMISSATQQSDRTLGAMYIVMGLSKVSYKCSSAYAWLG